MIHSINMTLNFSAILITIMLLIVAAISQNWREKADRIFFIILLLTLITELSDFFIGIIAGTSGYATYIMIRLADYISYALWGIQLIAWAIYLLEYMKHKKIDIKKQAYLIVCLGVGASLLSTPALFTDFYTRLDANNVYYASDLVWVSKILPILALITTFIVTLQQRKALSTREWRTLLLYPIAPVICYIIELLYDGLWIAYIGGVFTLFLVYVNNQLEIKLKLKEQEVELTENRITIMLSQIQPHFLYNALCAIDKLCYDTPEAHKAIITFSEYLRVNMDSLTRKELIPFEKELEHTKQYLWLEQLRFEERLQVQYDIQTTEFTLPALTLQPIVENAVKHGITKKRRGGTVTIQTKKGEHAYQIVITDDGVGFHSGVSPEDDHSHIGIANVRSRLASMCDGTLHIESQENNGTVAIIEIPFVKSSYKHKNEGQKWSKT